MSFIAATIHPARRRGLAHASEVWGIAERRLGAREWAVGRYSIADIHLFRLYWRFANSLRPSAGTFPNLANHYERMMARRRCNGRSRPRAPSATSCRTDRRHHPVRVPGMKPDANGGLDLSRIPGDRA